MKCPECNGAMVHRSRYVWNVSSQRMITVYYYRCIDCGYIVDA